MRKRLLSLAVLAGVAATLFVGVGPAAADDGVDCNEVFVIDPTLCDDDLPPPPAPSMRSPGPDTIQPMPSGTPRMMPLPGETCAPGFDFSDDAVIVQTGFRDVPIYTFSVRVDYCFRDNIVTQARVIPTFRPVVPQDMRVLSISQPRVYTGPSGLGTPRFDQGQDIFTEFSPDGVNTELYRHIVAVFITPGNARPAEVFVDLFPCRGLNPATC